MNQKNVYINGVWEEGKGAKLQKVNPATGELIWEGPSTSKEQIDQAVKAARKALSDWARKPKAERARILEAFAEQLKKEEQALTDLISLEIGKPAWEARTEVKTMAAKVGISIDAETSRRAEVVKQQGIGNSCVRYKPYGVFAVLGPFNFPGHLPNGHIVPALLAGNTIVFKPSEQATLVARKTVECWHNAGLPAGVLNLVPCARGVGSSLTGHPDINGVLFTGGLNGGLALNHLFVDRPDKVLALELGGNNPLVVWEPSNQEAAVFYTIQSAFITAGQRCACARRLILPDNDFTKSFLKDLVEKVGKIRVGAPDEKPEPYMGPVISSAAAGSLLKAQKELIEEGAKPLLESRLLKENTGLLSPGILDVTSVKNRPDEELFGPILQVIRVKDFDAAIAEANNTRFGLTAGLLSDRRDLYEKFFDQVRAGVINWNQQTTGASSAAPFGGAGLSGNNRPSAYFAADYCSYPIASMEFEQLTMPKELPPGLN